ncbi:MAG TPA: GNAT family N-acetyltransferase [Tepidisphaeraceae bacterium]|jgi:GNAT superfamily N-acetyltransferase
MSPSTLTIEPLPTLDLLVSLAADARSDGRKMVDRFIQEWTDGRNRFDQPGEHAYIAKLGAEVCGICGLNRDPFANDLAVGRVRRLYVATAYRRQGIGAAIIHRLLRDAHGVFRFIHLRTHDANAAAFYESLGFQPVQDNPECTHRYLMNS